MTSAGWIVALRWIERLLLATGVTLAVWCTAVLLQARHVSNLPIPHAGIDVPLPAAEAARPSRPAEGTWVAKLEVPARALSATVLEGTDDGTLRLGAGHIRSTAAPGSRGNVGIAGHRDTVFRPLRNARIGDTVLLTTAEEVREYRIVRTMVVNPEDVYVLDETEHPTLTLVTCYPFAFIGSAPQRFIVRADLTATRPRTGP